MRKPGLDPVSSYMAPPAWNPRPGRNNYGVRRRRVGGMLAQLNLNGEQSPYAVCM